LDNLKEGDSLEDICLGMIILKFLVKKLVGRTWIGFIWRRVGTGGGVCEDNNEPSDWLKCREFHQ
jgi:hypothetical protein